MGFRSSRAPGNPCLGNRRRDAPQSHRGRAFLGFRGPFGAGSGRGRVSERADQGVERPPSAPRASAAPGSRLPGLGEWGSPVTGPAPPAARLGDPAPSPPPTPGPVRAPRPAALPVNSPPAPSPPSLGPAPAGPWAAPDWSGRAVTLRPRHRPRFRPPRDRQ